jgi:hypothetical protein
MAVRFTHDVVGIAGETFGSRYTAGIFREIMFSNISSAVLMYNKASTERLSVETAVKVGNCQILLFKF